MLEENENYLSKKIKEMYLVYKGKDGKRKIENLIVFIIILIITVILINTIWNGNKYNEEIPNTKKILAKEENESRNEDYKSPNLEEKIENILESIEGVGKVKVLLTYSESSQTVAMYNEDVSKSDTEETDNRAEEIEK